MNGRHLYFIQANVTGSIKIGRSKNVQKRLGQLQVGCPQRLRILLILEDKGHIERDLHRRLYHHRIRQRDGEWFGPDCLWDLAPWIYEQLDLDMLDWWQVS